MATTIVIFLAMLFGFPLVVLYQINTRNDKPESESSEEQQ